MTAETTTEHPPHFLRQVSKNVIWLGVGYVVSRMMTLGMLMLLTRTLSMAELGRFTMLTTLIGLCETIPVFGIDRLALREVGRDSVTGWSEVPHFLGFVFAFSLLLAGVLATTVWCLDMSGGSVLLAGVTGLIVIPESCVVVLGAAFQGAQMMSWFARGLIVLSSGSLLTVGVASLWGLGLDAIFLGFFLSHILHLGLLLYAAPIRVRPRFVPSRWRSTLFDGAPYALSNVLGILQLKLDLLFVAWLSGEEGVAIYGVAFKFVELTILVSVIGVVALLPNMARLRTHPQQLERTYILCLKISALAALPIAFLVFWHSDILLRVIFTDQYLGAQSTLHLLTGVMFFSILQVPNWAVLLSAPEQRFTVIVSVVTLSLNAFLNMLLIPPLGPLGAAAAALCATAVGTVLSMFFIQKSFDSSGLPLLRWVGCPAFAGGAALLLFAYGSLLYFSQSFSAFIGLVAYVGVVIWVDARASDQSLLTLCLPRLRATLST